VLFPAGRIIDQHHIVDFHVDSVGVIVLNDADELLFIHSYRYATDSINWEIVAGRMESNESVEEAALREVVEETGCSTTNHFKLYSFQPINGISDKTMHIVVCRANGFSPEFDRNEVESFRWVSFQEAKEMIQRQEIRDGFSLVGLLLLFSGIVDIPV
jgi:ADP-ribose pyrophosphatase